MKIKLSKRERKHINQLLDMNIEMVDDLLAHPTESTERKYKKLKGERELLEALKNKIHSVKM